MDFNLNTWLISDTHFGHKNIIKYCNRPEKHDYLIINNWQTRVGEKDVVLHLGDLMVWYGKDFEKAQWVERIRNLNGVRYILRGNHDGHLTDKDLSDMGFTVIPEFIQEIRGRRVLFSHFPDSTRIGEWDINVHGHIHNSPYNPEYKETRDYRNISIEVMDYKPVRLENVVGGRSFQSRKEAGTHG